MTTTARVPAVLTAAVLLASVTLWSSEGPGKEPQPASAAASEGSPWPAPVKGFVAPTRGEHPRLFFRKSDLPEIRKRAGTPEGQFIVKRLRELLGGGEEMPGILNKSGAAYAGNTADETALAKKEDPKSGSQALPAGTYTIGHAAGFGMLYQLTGDRKYAELGKQCFEKAWEGVRDRDDRYSWKAPGGALRCGPSIGAYAIGYDLCYDGWDADFRKKVAQAFMNYNEGKDCSLESCARGQRQFPACNHWGAEIGGPALVLLAIRGDDGADDKKVDELLDANAKCFIRNLTEGWGDHGYFAEGDGPGTISSDTSFVPALQAWRVAGGRDFITPRPNAQWLTLKWVMQTVAPGDRQKGPVFPSRGVYEHNVWSRVGMSGSGTFAQGFGAVGDEFKPAILWTYNHCVSPGQAEFDTISPYPHRAVLALINWPLGAKEDDPAKVLPKAVEDKKYAYYMFRNKWEGADDIVVTALLRGSKGNYSVPGGEIIVLGLGQRTAFPIKVTGNPTHFEATDTGGVVSTSAGSFGVDFSGASGADALLVLAGSVQGGIKTGKGFVQLQAGKNTYTVMTLQKGAAPEVKPDGDDIVVGSRRVKYDGQKIAFTR